MGGLILTLSVIFVLSLTVLTARFVTRMNKLENTVNNIKFKLENNEQLLLECGNNNSFLNNGDNTSKDSTRKKIIPVVWCGKTHLVESNCTMRDFIQEVGTPDKTDGNYKNYNLYYYSSIKTVNMKVIFSNGELNNISFFKL